MEPPSLFGSVVGVKPETAGDWPPHSGVLKLFAFKVHSVVPLDFDELGFLELDCSELALGELDCGELWLDLGELCCDRLDCPELRCDGSDGLD